MTPTISEESAGWIVAVGAALATAWKLWFRAKRDVRDDKGDGDKTAGYRDLIHSLREEVTRLSESVALLSARLDYETMQRRAAEAENGALKARILHLEGVVRELGGTV